ncbi:DUF5677 domain-containing protein [Priestia megaterium]|uniref:DUF5677 domain-containing protein n=1 Tax=Priestia megaterium TaxID=1404 RepID=UPI0012B6FB48|nr:DUF5677 domain-containing protein [Priestia megaterium]
MTKADDYLLEFSNAIVNVIFKELKGEKDEPEIQEVMPLLLFKTMLDKIHAIKLLVDTEESRVGENTFSIARTITECKWCLLYMIKSDTHFRARAYYYFSRLDEAKTQVAKLKYLKSVTQGHLNNRNQDLARLVDIMNEYDKAIEEDIVKASEISYNAGVTLEDLNAGIKPTDIFKEKHEILNNYITDLSTQIVEIDKRIQEYERRISTLRSNSTYADIRKEIGKLPKKPKKLRKFPTWYSLKEHISSVRKLTEHLGLVDEYDGIYGTYSQDIHILNATKQIRLIEDKAVLKDEDSSSTNAEALESYSFSMTVLSSVVGDFLTHYGKDVQKKQLKESMAKLYLKK